MNCVCGGGGGGGTVYWSDLHSNHLSSYIQYMGHCQSMDELATSSHPKIVTRCVFRGWLRVTGEERVKGWELMTKARRFRERYTHC